MPGGSQHKLMTQLALGQLPEGALAQLGGEAAADLLLETCCYPDAYFDLTNGGHERAAPYALLIEGIQFHYLPNSPTESEYKFWGVTPPDSQDRRKLERLHRLPNRNWRHAWVGFNYYLDKMVECLQTGDFKEAAGFLGTLLHVLQDAAAFIHALEGPDGLDVFALDGLITPPDDDPALLPSLALAGRTVPCTISDYVPMLLGTGVPEAAFRLYSAYARTVKHSRRMLTPLLYAIYEKREADADRLCAEMLQTGARLCADAAFTAASIAADRFDPVQKSALDEVCLSELEPVSRPRVTSQPYGLVGLTRDHALDENRQRCPLALMTDGKRREFERGFGSGTHFDCKTAFELPAGVYRTFTCWVGAHADLSRKPGFTAGIKLRGDAVRQADITSDNPACFLKCDVSGGGLLELFAESDRGLGHVNSVVWGDPLLYKDEKDG